MARSLAVSVVLLAARGALAAPAAGLPPQVVARVEEALACVNLAVSDLGWDKRPVADGFRLACVNEALDQPLALASRAERAEADFAADPVAAAHATARWLEPLPPPRRREPVARADRATWPGAGPATGPLATLWHARRDARAWHDRALQDLGPADRALLLGNGARLYVEEGEEEADAAPVLDAASRIDLGSLQQALLALARAAQRLRAVSAAELAAAAPRTWTRDGVRVVLGGPGADTHDAEVVLDTGGDDTYLASCRFVVDLAGDDTYRGAGNAYMDAALLLDTGGDDRHVGGSFTQGGAAFGASLLLDAGGDDRYEAGQVAQGAAFFGIGMLLDLGGEDAYRGERFVQGFGGVRGLGVLSDAGGNDTYRAGFRFAHAPLLPEHHQSLSQGFGFGLRGAGASGGVGILVDHAGNDAYAAEVYGQGASYWLALGVLVDAAGHDRYDLAQYGQGAGIHLSAGVLVDRAGSDGYTCSNGVAQGSGHDWAVGLLWDRAGFDAYQGSGMSQGGANANGIGMLVDEGGNDSYAGWNEKNQGDSFHSRGTIGLGVLIDMQGLDRYTHGGSDGALWTRGTVGVGLDVASPPPEAEPGP
jgi:hypothetical protein